LPRRCSICHHERSEEINRALVGSTALSEIAALFRVSDDALSRHKAKHLPTALAKTEKARETAQAEDLLSELRGLQTRTVAILEAAETSGEHRTALAAIGEARRNLELLGKLAGIEGFRDIGSYDAGDFDHSFEEREVLPVSDEERETALGKKLENAQRMIVLRRSRSAVITYLGWDDDEEPPAGDDEPEEEPEDDAPERGDLQRASADLARRLGGPQTPAPARE
jgi:hypothetical protein